MSLSDLLGGNVASPQLSDFLNPQTSLNDVLSPTTSLSNVLSPSNSGQIGAFNLSGNVNLSKNAQVIAPVIISDSPGASASSNPSASADQAAPSLTDLALFGGAALLLLGGLYLVSQK